MADLIVPDPPESIYRYRGGATDPVPYARPLFQGDIFPNVTIPGVSASPFSIVISHPCTMRQGPALRGHLLLAAVRTTDTGFVRLCEKNFRVAGLPQLDGGSDYIACFEEVGRVASGALSLGARSACLSDYGLAYLQQRQIYFLTRYEVEVDALDEQNAPLHLEAELLEEWREGAFEGLSTQQVQQHEQVVDREFDQYFAKHRSVVNQRAQHGTIRRDVRAEVGRRL